ncbi:MAG: DMT family transporter [Treponema sp.]|nr:DMT family transporter [Treponema sp.]
MNVKTRSLLASTGLLLTAAIWGFAFVVVKDSLDYIGAVWMLAFRFTIAAAVLSLVYARRLLCASARAWKHGLLLGVYLFVAYLVQTVGCKYTTAGKNAFLTTVYVFLVPLLGWPLNKKRPAWYVFACALMSIAGIGLLALGTGAGAVAAAAVPSDAAGAVAAAGSSGAASAALSVVNIGDVLTLICGIFYAVHILFTARYNEEHDPVLLTVMQFIAAAALSWLFAPILDGAFPVSQALSSRIVISMLYLGLLSTLIAFVLQNVGLKYLPSALASLLLSFESVFGVLFSALLLHEHLSLRMAVGCVLIFAAVVIAQVKQEN